MADNDVALSVVVPVYNEAGGLAAFHESLLKHLEPAVKNSFEIIYCDDGSVDETAQIVRRLHDHDRRVKLLKLSRNFGKENTLAAGVAAARGQAIVTIDGDGQHPPALLPKFVEAWRDGAQVVIGVRTNTGGKGWTKNTGPKVFYKILDKLTDQEVVPGASDYRLIDASVQSAFLKLQENNRTTRGLIDWLGYKRQLIPFEVRERAHGSPGYSRAKLFNLAADSFVSLSPKPLYLFGLLGVGITILSFLLGVAVVLEQLILGDPLQWKFSGTAMLGILILFLVGVVLMSQGILSLYISHIHNQSKGRPLYIIDYSQSVGIDDQPLSSREAA